MAEIAVQPSFSGGEWSPNLYSRVDISKYRSAAALLENWFVDYRNGASTRPGTKYVIQAYDSANPVRLISFQSSFNIGYAIEIGNGYMRFIYQGAPVLETAFNITAITKAAQAVATVTSHDFVVGDWIYITGVSGMTQVNGRYFRVDYINGNDIGLSSLNNVDLNSTAYSTYTSGGTAARIYKITSPYTSADDLRLIKFSQSSTTMILCHPNHPVYKLTLVSANNWTLIPATFGATVSAPTISGVTTTLAAGTINYAYGVTSIDGSGQESSMSTAGTLANKTDIRATATPGSNTVAWTAVAGAVAYNVYEASLVYGAAVPSGAQYGFIGTTQGVSFVDSNIAQDFSVTPPISKDPFNGYTVSSITVTAPGAYTSVPTVAFTGSCTTPATATVTLVMVSDTINAAGSGYAVNDLVTFSNGVVMIVLTIGGGGTVTNAGIYAAGSVTSGSTPSNPMSQVSTTGAGTGFKINGTWGVGSVDVTSGGAGYASAPTVTFSSGAATATANISANPIYPEVPGFVQQRLFLGGSANSPATFYLSKAGQYFNFDISLPASADDSITGTLVSSTLNSIKSVVGSSAGGLIFTDKAVWLLNGGSYGSAVTAINAVANPQSYIGASDVPPIIANYDILFVQSKGSAVRSLTYSVYQNVYTGADISVTAAHLFFGHTVDEWCWAESPFYSAQAVMDHGTINVLTYMKDQEYIGWSHYTTNGLFKSICSVTEVLSSDVAVDAVYAAVARTVNAATVQYIERFAERDYSAGYASASVWCVDSGLQYNGTPATSFTGGEHLAGLTVTGLADGAVITPFVMASTGFFTLATAASVVTIGLAYNCDLQTLPLDVGEPSIQGVVKKIASADVRVVDTLGLQIGSSFDDLVDMQDLVLGNLSSALTGQVTQVVSDLVTGDAITYLDPTYTVPGQYCIRQDKPYPATIAGLFPRFEGEKRNER
jgi:hypothetical protein